MSLVPIPIPLKSTLQTGTIIPKPRPLAPRDNSVARYEMKYLVDVRLREPIQQFVSLFCEADPFSRSTPPTYSVVTLQFDSPWGGLYLGKDDKAMNRFKLRARTYGSDGKAPLFLEIKRKLGDVVVKSRAVFDNGWGDLEGLILGDRMSPLLRHGSDMAFLEFRRLIQELGAAPVLRLRYDRESYVSGNDLYARVTFDSAMEYHPQRAWTLDGRETAWKKMDTGTAMNRSFPTFVLELKTTDQMPSWMAELIERFNLTRTDFCKYATAVRLESLHKGFMYTDASENCY